MCVFSDILPRGPPKKISTLESVRTVVGGGGEEGSCSLDAALPVGCRPGFLAQVSSSPTITTIGRMLDVFLLAACYRIILKASKADI